MDIHHCYFPHIRKKISTPNLIKSHTLKIILTQILPEKYVNYSKLQYSKLYHVLSQ